MCKDNSINKHSQYIYKDKLFRSYILALQHFCAARAMHSIFCQRQKDAISIPNAFLKHIPLTFFDWQMFDNELGLCVLRGTSKNSLEKSLRKFKKVLCLHPQNGACPGFRKFFFMFSPCFWAIEKKFEKKLEKVLTETEKGFIFAPA